MHMLPNIESVVGRALPLANIQDVRKQRNLGNVVQ